MQLFSSEMFAFVEDLCAKYNNNCTITVPFLLRLHCLSELLGRVYSLHMSKQLDIHVSYPMSKTLDMTAMSKQLDIYVSYPMSKTLDMTTMSKQLDNNI